MAILAEITAKIDHCTNGFYLRWYHSQGGWHYALASGNREAELKADNKELFTELDYSNISKSQIVLDKDFTLTYSCAFWGVSAAFKDAVVGMLECETVQWFKGGIWQDVDVVRKTFSIKSARGVAYNIEFEFEFENYLDDIL